MRIPPACGWKVRRWELRIPPEKEAGHVWLAGDQPTIADIDLFGVVVFADESGDDLTAYPAIRGWMDRFSALPHFAPPSTLLPPESRKAV